MLKKRICAGFMALVMVLLLTVGASATTTSTARIYDVDTKNFHQTLKDNGNSKLILLNKTAITYDKLANLSIQPGDELKIYLTANMFLDNQGTRLSSTATHISRAQIRQGAVSIRRSTSSGSSAFESIAIRYDKVGTYLSIRFVKEFVSVKDLDFSTAFYMVIGDKRKNDTKFTVAGTMAMETIPVYNGDDFVDISDGVVAEAEERVTGIDMYLGCDLTVNGNLTKGYKYFGICTNDITNADYAVIGNYPAVEDVLYVKSINIKSASKSVKIDRGNRFYVYDSYGRYIGTTGQALPYFTKYYLSSKKYDSLKIS